MKLHDANGESHRQGEADPSDPRSHIGHGSIAAQRLRSTTNWYPIEKLGPRPVPTPGLGAGEVSLAGACGGLGTRRGRSLLAGAKTPAYRTVCRRGGGTEEANRQSRESGSKASPWSLSCSSAAGSGR
jgi:hypothetical protein